jgi:hypothetical protein
LYSAQQFGSRQIHVGSALWAASRACSLCLHAQVAQLTLSEQAALRQAETAASTQVGDTGYVG